MQRLYKGCTKWVVQGAEMQTIREYAKNNGVSYEAIRKQIKTYEVELKDHIMKNGRTQYLDDYAVEFLNKKRANSTIIETKVEQTEYIKSLEVENKNLLIKIAELEAELITAERKINAEKEKVELLQTEKIQLLEEKQTKPDKKKWWWQK